MKSREVLKELEKINEETAFCYKELKEIYSNYTYPKELRAELEILKYGKRLYIPVCEPASFLEYLNPEAFIEVKEKAKTLLPEYERINNNLQRLTLQAVAKQKVYFECKEIESPFYKLKTKIHDSSAKFLEKIIDLDFN